MMSLQCTDEIFRHEYKSGVILIKKIEKNQYKGRP